MLLAARGDATVDRERSDLDVAEAVSRAQARAVERIMPSVVSISAYGKDGEEFGSGLIVGAGGDVVTALHVVRNATAIEVRLADGTNYPAVRVAHDAYADLALLRIKGAAVAPARIGDESTVRPGGTLLVVGNPFVSLVKVAPPFVDL